MIFFDCKAKSAANGQWLFGPHAMEKDGKLFLLTSKCNDTYIHFNWVEIIADTLCARTPFVDIHYAFMYENDIVANRNHHWVGVVVPDESNAENYRINVYIPDGEPLPEDYEESNTTNWEIIGNLHDNPNLLSDFYREQEVDNEQRKAD